MLLPLNLLFKAASLLQQFLRLFLIVPEILSGCLVFNTLQLLTAGRHIKETSRAVPRACSSLRKKSLIPVMIKFRSLVLPKPFLFIRSLARPRGVERPDFRALYETSLMKEQLGTGSSVHRLRQTDRRAAYKMVLRSPQW